MLKYNHGGKDELSGLLLKLAINVSKPVFSPPTQLSYIMHKKVTQ
jgi:hypothetical protein